MDEDNSKKWKRDGKSIIRKIIILFIIPVGVISTGTWYYLHGDRYISTDNSYIKSETTSISAEVSGRVIRIGVADHSYVSEGQELFQIDPEPYQIAVSRAEADLSNTRVEMQIVRSDYIKTLAELAIEQENVRYRKSEYDRYKDLEDKQVISIEKLNQIYYDHNNAINEYEAAKQEVEVLKAKLGGNPDAPIEDHPKFKRVYAELEKAKLDLSRVNVISPTKGIAVNMALDTGEYLLAGMPLFTLVDEDKQWIEANFKETDLTNIRVGQPAEVEVDTFPGKKWAAKVTSITPATGAEFSILPAQNSSGNWVKVVQRIMR
ncbi:MAG: HlyD family secretion protein [Kordiimonadaceae bacterium]|nr:HlyD family secretion protein [Kordiimonadaceae bacterium]MBT6035162.1 HlyD family secretion protein [Kordiimonadaceae bacterium]